jgi:hypothetical protein
MKRLAIVVLMVALAAPPAGSYVCIPNLPGDWDDCSIRRRPGREPAEWCGGGGGSRGSWGRTTAEALRQLVEKYGTAVRSLAESGSK